ncbi:MAG: ParB/RepB/Spo0J family partition protein [candidate division WOR-3 bacterium]|jgi:ParB family chromosome partitioning protein
MNKKARGLGRGLAAILPGSESLEDLQLIDINAIEPNPYQPRRKFSEKELKELAESIKANGLLQPIIVRQISEDRYQIVAGERRWRACRIAGLTKIPAIVKDLEDSEMLQLALIENLQREDLNPVEEALAYKQLIEKFGFTQSEIAQIVGKDRATITNTLRLLNLSEKVLEMLRDGKITEGHARVLLRISDFNEQEEWARRIVEEGISVRQLEKLISPKESKMENDNSWIREISEKLFKNVGLKAEIKTTKRRVRVVLDFKNKEEFENFLRKLGL